MAALTDLTLAQLSAAMVKKEASALEVADAHLRKLDEHRALNAFITETPDRARDMAKASDARRAKGEVGLLEGVPLAIKDLFCTEGVQTTAASHILEGFVPQYESTVTANLWKAGATMVGKTNLDEFAMGSSNMTSHFGGVENPWKRRGDNRKLVPSWVRPFGRAVHMMVWVLMDFPLTRRTRRSSSPSRWARSIPRTRLWGRRIRDAASH